MLAGARSVQPVASAPGKRPRRRLGSPRAGRACRSRRYRLVFGGAGLTPATDRLTIKTILGYRFGPMPAPPPPPVAARRVVVERALRVRLQRAPRLGGVLANLTE